MTTRQLQISAASEAGVHHSGLEAGKRKFHTFDPPPPHPPSTPDGCAWHVAMGRHPMTDVSTGNSCLFVADLGILLLG